ncbi:hypothetical protein GCM10010211_60270 [Streptomyces albospinus]|uniref:Uncharacterized protein n=1 Tax=Streptomyces albospinus TaxID=285515 RepID=A0ABQ2VK11_9ACTN|nr:hypothetical protein GCM10010211_60270 [Streptomyces albospinus]
MRWESEGRGKNASKEPGERPKTAELPCPVTRSGGPEGSGPPDGGGARRGGAARPYGDGIPYGDSVSVSLPAFFTASSPNAQGRSSPLAHLSVWS